MRKTSAALLLTSLAGFPLASLAEDSPHTFAAKVSLWTEYEYRGIRSEERRVGKECRL